MNQGLGNGGGKPWFVFEVGDPSQEAQAMAMAWLGTQEGLNLETDELVELICTDPASPNDLEGCIHLLVWNGEVEGEEFVDISGAQHLGVLEEADSEDGPYNVMVAAALRRDGEAWIASLKNG